MNDSFDPMPTAPRPLIYLASPYTHPCQLVQALRWRQVEEATAYLLKEGHLIYSPIVHCHSLAQQYQMPGDFNFWKDYCLDMLTRADELWVLQLDGWDRSHGVLAEIDYARINKKPIRYVTQDLLDITYNDGPF